jgi:hypothetical protein
MQPFRNPCFLILVLALATPATHAQVLWDGESRVPVDFARGVTERLRQNFWGKMQLPNGEVAQPASEAERAGIPIPERLAHSLVTAGALSAKAEECDLKTDAFELRVLKAAWNTYPALNQVVFSGTLLSLSKATVKRQQSVEVCTAENREGFASLLGIK